ncbi:MAG: hypothetical protein PHN90_07220, partial [Methanothrix sp.]|nr:hypothetical protein [Methanothrix sp.]
MALARELATVFILTIFAAAPVWAADNPEGYYIKNEQKLEQDVAGEGFVMVYQKVNTESLQLKNYLHGSGTMDAAFLISSNQSSSGGTCTQDQNTLAYIKTGKDSDAYAGNVSFLEQNEMVYSPVAMAYGTGYYAENPIVYNSKLKERTEAKNYNTAACGDGQGVSMLHQIEYASAFVKDIGVELKNQEKWPQKGYSSTPINGFSSTKMKIEEDVTEGSVHIGQLMTRAGVDCKSGDAWKNPLIEIDENYIGTFKITKNMEICTSCKGSKPRADWLTCCIGGYGT